MNKRKKIARSSIIISTLEQISAYVLSFVARRIILVTIGIEYLGLNATLAQMLGALSVTELGVQGVIIYRLYKPVAQNDHKSVCELISIIRKFYQIIALIIVIGSIVLLPFLRLIITNINVSWNTIYVAWFMMALSSALSYTMNYNSVVLFADQKQYIYQAIHLV